MSPVLLTPSRLSLALAVALALAACGESPEASPAAPAATEEAPPAAEEVEEDEEEMPDVGRHGVGDVYGFYLPTSKVSAGYYQLDYAYLGTPAEFEAWEADPSREAPVVFVFCILDHSTEECEPGEQIRMPATVFLVMPDVLMFVGEDEMVGPVRFEGILDTAAVATANRDAATTTGEVLEGDFTLGATSHPGVTFTWFTGE